MPFFSRTLEVIETIIGGKMVREKKLSQVDYVAGLLGAMMMICFWLIVATLPDFFFINPTGTESEVRRAELVLSTIGWVLLSTGAPILLFFYSAGFKRARKFLPITALWWPLSLLISQITVYILDGAFYFDYLIKFPIFIFTDIILPIFVLILAHDLREEVAA
jgi:hypothetical protein